MNKNLVEIVVALDASGSMSSIKGATIEGFNVWLAEQKKQPGEVRLTVVKFDSDLGPRLVKIADRIDIQKFDGLTDDNYTPLGGTPLYYTQGKLIDDTGAYLASLAESDRPAKVMFVTLTDGADTDAWQHPGYSREIVKAKTEHQRAVYNWDFSYIGANQDAQSVAVSLGIPSLKAMTFAADIDGAKQVFRSMSTYSTTVRSSVAMNLDTEVVGYTDEDRDAQVR